MGPDEIIASLGLQPLPVEGGLYAENLKDPNASAIYYMLVAPQFSALHKLTHLEVFAYHAGAPARMTLISPGGALSQPVLGMDLAAGQRPQVVVPAGTWQATETLGPWTLLGTFMSPPYTDDSVTFADASLAAAHPKFADEIHRLLPR